MKRSAAIALLASLLCLLWPGTAPVFSQSLRLLKDAPQYHYQRGVPHTDRQGNRLLRYVPGRSFFPIFLNQAGEPGQMRRGFQTPLFDHGYRYLQDGHFNVAFIWHTPPRDVLPDADRFGLPVLVHYFADSDIANHPQMLGWVTEEEIGRFVNDGTVWDQFAAYQRTRGKIRAVNPHNIVTIIDNMWLGLRLDQYFAANSAGRKWSLDATDVYFFDYYHFPVNRAPNWVNNGEVSPFQLWPKLRQHFHEAKPIWIMLGAADYDGGPNFSTSFPAPAQLRCEAFLSIIMGATGISYFSFDWYGARDGNFVGIRPDTPLAYEQKGIVPPGTTRTWRTATPEQQRQSRALWAAVRGINQEIGDLAPVILQPTAAEKYEVRVANDGFYPTPVYTMLKQYQGRWYLWIVNIDAEKPARVEVKLPDGSRVEGLLKPYDARVVRFNAHSRIQL